MSTPEISLHALLGSFERDQYDLVDRIRSQVAQACHRLGQGEGVAYGVSMTVVPGNQPGAFVPVIVLTLTMPGAVLTERTMATSVIMDLHLSDEAVNGQVDRLLEALRQARSEALAQR